MNKFKKLLALLLALALFFSMTACSERKDETITAAGNTTSGTTTAESVSTTTTEPVTTEIPTEITTEPATEAPATEKTTQTSNEGELFAAIGDPALDSAVVGTWVAVMDYGKMMEASQAEMAQLGEMGEAMMTAFEGVTMDVMLELHEDGSYSFGIEEESARAGFEKMMPTLLDAMVPMIIGMSGMSEEDFTKQLEAQGMTMEEFTKQMMGQFDVEDMVDSIKDAVSNGSWRYLDGKLYLVEDGKTVDPEQYMTVELAGDKLTMTEIHNSANAADGEMDNNEMYKAMLPMEFTRK